MKNYTMLGLIFGFINSLIGTSLFIAFLLFVFSDRNFVQSMSWPVEVYVNMRGMLNVRTK